jgi:hypothetical protein
MIHFEITDDIADHFHIGHETGWRGPFTRREAPQARYPNGSRVRKAKHERGDVTTLGTMGTVLGSLYVPNVGVGYFVEWENRPRVAVFVVEYKVST